MLKMRGDHTQTIQKLKSQFLTEKKEFQQESEAKIQEVAKQANRVSIGVISFISDSHLSENQV